MDFFPVLLLCACFDWMNNFKVLHWFKLLGLIVGGFMFKFFHSSPMRVKLSLVESRANQ